MRAKLSKQIHDDLYDALRSVETWELETSTAPLAAIAPIARGLAELLDACLRPIQEGDEEGQQGRNVGP